MFRLGLFIVVVFYCQNTLGDKKSCPLDDSDCLTRGAKKTYQSCVDGDLKGVPSSDPLHIDFIDGILPKVNYTLRNVTLYGLKTCSPELVKLDLKSEGLFYNYHVACRHLNMLGQYDVNGKVGTMDIEGNGDFKVDYYDYVFLFNGELEQSYDDEKKLHIHVKNFNLDIDIRGNVIYNFKNLFNGNTEKSTALHEYTTAHGKETNKALRKPVMEKFMSLFINNINAYLKVVPVEDVFPK